MRDRNEEKDSKKKIHKKMKENGVTVALPFETEWHVIDYDEGDDDFTVTCFDAEVLMTGEIIGRYSTFFDAWMDAKFFDKDRSDMMAMTPEAKVKRK